MSPRLHTLAAVGVALLGAVLVWSLAIAPFAAARAAKTHEITDRLNRIEIAADRLTETRRTEIAAQRARLAATPELEFAPSAEGTAERLEALRLALETAAAGRSLRIVRNEPVSRRAENGVTRLQARLALEGPWADVSAVLADAEGASTDRFLERVEIQPISGEPSAQPVRIELHLAAFAFPEAADAG
ncbi:MAG: hypothetical protein AAGL49_14790 [Pseudomonadota bacterium]